MQRWRMRGKKGGMKRGRSMQPWEGAVMEGGVARGSGQRGWVSCYSASFSLRDEKGVAREGAATVCISVCL